MLHLYVIRSIRNGKRYVGISAPLGQRLLAHARRQTKGGNNSESSSYTNVPWYVDFG